MYVCVGHGFTDSQVRDLTAQGCRSIAEVYRCLAGGEPPQCGKCVPFVRKMIKTSAVAIEAVATVEPVYAAAAAE
jgi:bacterioferritin-associated ferredoxin